MRPLDTAARLALVLLAATPAPGPSAFDAWGLAAHWVGSGAAVVSVGVAVLFGYLTLANTRRSRDAQNLATIVAAGESPNGSGVLLLPEEKVIEWTVQPNGGESWLLVNDGQTVAYDVTLRGLTVTDQERLRTADGPDVAVVEPAESVPFEFVSRLTLSGPGNVVVSWTIAPGGPELRKAVRVPAR